MNKPTVIILGADAQTEAAIRQVLRSVAAVSGEAAPLDRALEVYRARPAHVAVVVVTPPMDAALRQVAALTGAGARVVVVAPNKDPDLILGTMRAGAKEFVLDGDEAELRRAIVSQAPSMGSGNSSGELITVFPTRGGVGATTVAVNLGGALQRRGNDTCLLDFDLYLGDVLSFLDLPGRYSISDALANRARLDRELLDTSLARHASGLRVLAQSGKVEDAETVRAADALAVVDLMRKHYRHLVVDGISGFDELSLAVLDASQHIVMVLTQDVPSVRSAKRCIELFHRLGYDDRKIKLVVNRFHRNSKISAEVISEAIGLPVAHTLSNDFQSAIDAINRGQMLESIAPRSALTRDIEALAPLFTGAEDSGVERRGFFRGLWSRKANDGSNRAA
jgi:pilus assembly protein CpaE